MTKIRAILLVIPEQLLFVPCIYLLTGIRDIILRVERHVQNALKVVKFLNNHPQVGVFIISSVQIQSSRELYKKYFPNGGGSIFTFEIKGDDRKAKDFIDNLEIFSLLANVADVKSLVIHQHQPRIHSQ